MKAQKMSADHKREELRRMIINAGSNWATAAAQLSADPGAIHIEKAQQSYAARMEEFIKAVNKIMELP